MIEITSDYGCIAGFRWLNTNQDFHFEIAPARRETLPFTFPAWWGAFWLGDVPNHVERRLALVARMMTNEPQ